MSPFNLLFLSVHLHLFWKMSPAWRWTVWITSRRPWPVTAVCQTTFSLRIRRGPSAPHTMEQICWNPTPGIPFSTVNLQLLLLFSFLFLSLHLYNIYDSWKHSSTQYLSAPLVLTWLCPFLLSSHDPPISIGKHSPSLSLFANLCRQRFSHRQIPGPTICKSQLLFFMWKMKGKTVTEERN